MYITNLGCCGIKEIAGLSSAADSKSAMIQFCSGYSPTMLTMNHPEYYQRANAGLTIPMFNGAFAIFSEAGDKKQCYATKFAKFIEENELGKVVAIDGKINPNSKRQVRPFIWTIDEKAVVKWAKANCDWLAKVPEDKKAATVNVSSDVLNPSVVVSVRE